MLPACWVPATSLLTGCCLQRHAHPMSTSTLHMVSLFLSPSLHLLLSMSLDIQQHHGNSTGSEMSDLSPGQQDCLKSRNLHNDKSPWCSWDLQWDWTVEQTWELLRVFLCMVLCCWVNGSIAGQGTVLVPSFRADLRDSQLVLGMN